jgi:uncharacterized membrane protein
LDNSTVSIIGAVVGGGLLVAVSLLALVVWKTTSKPAEIAPHLDIILVAFSIFALPVTSAAGVIVGLMNDEIKGRIKSNE